MNHFKGSQSEQKEFSGSDRNPPFTCQSNINDIKSYFKSKQNKSEFHPKNKWKNKAWKTIINKKIIEGGRRKLIKLEEMVLPVSGY